MKVKISMFFNAITDHVYLFLKGILALIMIVGLLLTFKIIYQTLISHKKHLLIGYTISAYKLVNILVIILVAYELFKIINCAYSNRLVPATTILRALKISTIAVALKLVGLDLNSYDDQHMIGLAITLVSLGICFYLFSKYKTKTDQ